MHHSNFLINKPRTQDTKAIRNKNSEHGSLFFVVAACLALCFSLSACHQKDEAPQLIQQHVISGPIMGTTYRVTVRANSTIHSSVLEKAVLAAMQLVNQSMSSYINDSELNEFNQAPAGQALKLSDDLAEVLAESMSISELSDGAFDVTVAQAVRLWGFGTDGRITTQPSDEALNAIRANVGYKKLSLSNTSGSFSAIKQVDGLRIDLSAIAKGYAVDKVAKSLEQLGVNDYLINIGGELRAAGQSSDLIAWRVGIEKPHILGGIEQVIALKDQAIATSGNYRNYIEINGQRFSHTIDPSTLKPVLHRLALVSVLHAQASTADALATAMMAMGESKAFSFARENDLAAYFVIRQHDAEQTSEALYEIQMTEKFKQHLL